MKRIVALSLGLFAVSIVTTGCQKSSGSSGSSTTATSTTAAVVTDTSAPDAASTAASASTTAASPAGEADVTTPAVATAAADATTAATTNVTTDGASVPTLSYSQGNEKGSMGAGTSADLSATGLPIYPSIDPASAQVIKSQNDSETDITVLTKVSDDFKTVDDWYAGKLGSDFKTSRIDMTGMHMTTFVYENGGNSSTVMLNAAKDDGKDITTISLVVKKKP